jgi:hypothetical protein
MGVSFGRGEIITGKRWGNEFPQAPFFYFYLLAITRQPAPINQK